MQQLDGWLEPTRDRLRLWARWLRTTPSPIGQCVTVRYRAPDMEPGREVVADDDQVEAETVDRIMCRVRETDRQVYQVLYEYYYNQEISERDLAEMLRISRHRVSKLREQGETMVYVWWRASECGTPQSAARVAQA